MQNKRNVLNLRSYSQRLVFFITYEWAQKAKLFVLGKPFQPNLMCHSCLLGPYTHYVTQYICIYTLHTLTHYPNALHIHIQIRTLFTLHSIRTHTHTTIYTNKDYSHFTPFKHTLHSLQIHITHTTHIIRLLPRNKIHLYWCIVLVFVFLNGFCEYLPCSLVCQKWGPLRHSHIAWMCVYNNEEE